MTRFYDNAVVTTLLYGSTSTSAHRARLGRPGSRLPLRASVAWGGAYCGVLPHSLLNGTVCIVGVDWERISSVLLRKCSRIFAQNPRTRADS